MICGIWIVAAVYIYFLIFAQFAFLRLAQAAGLTGPQLRLVMGCMGGAGIGGSIVAARVFAETRAKRLLLAGFTGSAVAALSALGAWSSGAFSCVAILIGGFLGLLTVSLVGNLPRILPARQRGALIGLGTGLAYAVCNVPAVFAGSPVRQTTFAIAGCVAGAVLTLLIGRFDLGATRGTPEFTPEAAASLRPALVPLVIIFLALIWLDSAAFYILQNTPFLNRVGWGSATLQWNNAVVHFVVAGLAGVWLDRGRLTGVLALAFACLAGAALCVTSETAAAQLTHWLYAAGVSLYSAALVFTPLAGFSATQTKQSAWRAGVLYAVAGWAGSALGIGMAQDLHRIPRWFVGLASITVACALAWRTGRAPRASLRRAMMVAGAGTLALIVAQTSSARVRLQPRDGEPSAALGREVYISEGCINCHSQYVRPQVPEEIWWGPPAHVEQVLREEPPLIGNRRLGPDLMNVGNRRSAAWNRIHLMNPRDLLPGSKMPSYAYLFRPGDARGEALLAYLAELGADTSVERSKLRQRWEPPPGTNVISRLAQAAHFRLNCSQCHGDRGTGDGPLAGQLGVRRPRDLTRGEWQFMPSREKPAEQRLELARVIKFGVPGTSMPGHESLDDATILGLADYVESLETSGRLK
ncbi:MAG: cbb3-type cytochrome c oxidase subunit II [Verrucomicrobia bacterium]|nr:cbb3-type cytochrome c oxidase subunit II [Verrucomicrobiota bacterium]